MILNTLPNEFNKLKQFILEPFSKPLHTSKLFAFPKVHKPANSVRLLFPFSNHALVNLHKFLAKSLRHFVTGYDSVLMNVLGLVQKIDGRIIGGEATMCAADLKGFYPNVDREFAIKRVCECIRGDADMKIFPNQSSCEPLIRIAHDRLEFEFDNKLYEQATGVPIGSPSGPEIAIIALHSALQQTWSSLWEFDPIFVRMYFDDFFGLFGKQFISKEEITAKIHHLVAHQQCFKFDGDSFRISRVKELVTKLFDFLDIEIYAIQLTADSYMLKQRVYTKPMGAYQYVP